MAVPADVTVEEEEADDEYAGSPSHTHSLASLLTVRGALHAVRRLFCTCASQARVPLIDRWEMDPLTKWWRFSVFPRSVLLHVLLCVCVCVQIVAVNTTTSAFSQNLHNSFVTWFYPPDYAVFNGNPLTFATDTYYLYDAPRVCESVHTLMHAYFAMDVAGTSPVPDLIDTFDVSGQDTMQAPSLTYTTLAPIFDDALQRMCALAYTHRRAGMVTDAGDAAGTAASARNASDAHALQVAAAAARYCPDFGGRSDLLSSSCASDGTCTTTITFTSVSEYDAWEVSRNVSDYLLTTSVAAHVQLRAYNLAHALLTSRVCLLWDITVLYDMTHKGYARVSMDDFFNTCTPGWAAPSPLFFLAATIVVAATLQQFVLLRGWFRDWRIMRWASVLAQAARYHRRQQKIRRLIRKLQQRNRLATIAAANRALDAERTAPFASPSSTTSLAATPVDPHVAAAIKRVRQARIARLKRLLALQRFGTLDTTFWPFLRALLGCDRHNHKAEDADAAANPATVDLSATSASVTSGSTTLSSLSMAAEAPPVLQSAAEEAAVDMAFDSDLSSIDSESGSSSEEDDGYQNDEEDEDDGDDDGHSSCSCSSSEVSEEEGAVNPALEYLGLARRRVSSSSSSSSSSSEPKRRHSRDASRRRSRASSSSSSRSSGSSSSSSRRRRPRGYRSLAQSAAQAATAARRRRARSNAGGRTGADGRRRSASASSGTSSSSSSSASTPKRDRGSVAAGTGPRRRRGRSRTSGIVPPPEQPAGVPLSDGTMPPPPSNAALPRLTSAQQAELMTHTVDWADPTFLRRSANIKQLQEFTPLLKAIHRVRHAARHVRHRNLLSLLSFWPVVSTAANVCNIVYAIMSLVLGEAAVPGSGRLFLGLAAALDWITIAQYFKYNGEYFLLARTFSMSFPAILRNVAGSIPIFLSFAMFGCMAFGGLTERFDGLPFSAITLFAVANGDIVRETFQMTLFYQVGWFMQILAQVTMYVFCATFIYCILKTTTAINEQSYLVVRPLPSGAKAGARAAAIPGANAKAESAPLAFRLPKRVRQLLFAMQSVRTAGGSMAPVVQFAAASMPQRRRYTSVLLYCLRSVLCCTRCCASSADVDAGRRGSHAPLYGTQDAPPPPSSSRPPSERRSVRVGHADVDGGTHSSGSSARVSRSASKPASTSAVHTDDAPRAPVVVTWIQNAASSLTERMHGTSITDDDDSDAMRRRKNGSLHASFDPRSNPPVLSTSVKQRFESRGTAISLPHTRMPSEAFSLNGGIAPEVVA